MRELYNGLITYNKFLGPPEATQLSYECSCFGFGGLGLDPGSTAHSQKAVYVTLVITLSLSFLICKNEGSPGQWLGWLECPHVHQKGCRFDS